MLPQEKFALKYFYEGNFLGIISVNTTKDIENIMYDCHLKYKKGKNIKDLMEAFWGYGSMFKRDIDSYIEWALERVDKVVTINWATYLKAQ